MLSSTAGFGWYFYYLLSFKSVFLFFRLLFISSPPFSLILGFHDVEARNAVSGGYRGDRTA